MMTDHEVTQDQLDQLIDDVSYLQDEAEALKYVIDQVPYSENPPDGYSIYLMLKLLDHAQVNYFRPIVEKVFSDNRLINTSVYKTIEDSFEYSEEDEIDVDKVLNKIIKHRAALLNVLLRIPLIDWERELKDQDENIVTLFEFANNMVKWERGTLKKIADLVLIYQNEKLSRREIDARIDQHKSK